MAHTHTTDNPHGLVRLRLHPDITTHRKTHRVCGPTYAQEAAERHEQDVYAHGDCQHMICV